MRSEGPYWLFFSGPDFELSLASAPLLLGVDELPEADEELGVLGVDELPEADEELGALGVDELPAELELGLDGDVDDEDELGELGVVALPDIELEDDPLRLAGSAEDEEPAEDDGESPARSHP
ncbi:MAG TPA: hypothetical protein VG873_09760 [Burkholderiales bacterium]|nr:hypothetical protein [Burkholderiales bacterium]